MRSHRYASEQAAGRPAIQCRSHPSDGMVMIDEDYIRQNKKICVQLLAAFRYGREDLDVLGLTFRKDLISQFYQVCGRTKVFFFVVVASIRATPH